MSRRTSTPPRDARAVTGYVPSGDAHSGDARRRVRATARGHLATPIPLGPDRAARCHRGLVPVAAAVPADTPGEGLGRPGARHTTHSVSVRAGRGCLACSRSGGVVAYRSSASIPLTICCTTAGPAARSTRHTREPGLLPNRREGRGIPRLAGYSSPIGSRDHMSTRSHALRV